MQDNTHTAPSLLPSTDKTQPAKTKHDWPRLIKSWQASGLTQAIFCQQHGLSLPQFTYHRSRLKQKNSATRPDLLPLTVSSTTKGVSSPTSHKAKAEPFRLELSCGHRLIIPAAHQVAHLRSVLVALKGLR